MAFDYEAFAESQEKLWTNLQAYELLKGPFTAPWEQAPNGPNRFAIPNFQDFLKNVMDMRKKYIPVGSARLTGKSWMGALIDDICKDTPPVQPAAPVLDGMRTKNTWQDMQDAYERRKHRR